MWKPVALALLFAASLGWPAGAGAQAGDSVDERLDRIERELAEIKGMLLQLQRSQARGTAAAAPGTATANVAGEPFLGAPDAPLTLVEFTDYQCPYCQRFFLATLPELKKQYIETGKLKLVVKDLPLSMHPFAQKAAEASHCAEDQGKFWEMHDALFANSRQLSDAKIRELAKGTGLDTAAFELCLSAGLHKDAVLKDATEARRQRITGTPTFVLGPTGGDSVRGSVIRGAQSFESMKEQLDALGAEATRQD